MSHFRYIGLNIFSASDIVEIEIHVLWLMYHSRHIVWAIMIKTTMKG